MKYKDLGKMLSKEEMKTLKGGGPPGGGGDPEQCTAGQNCHVGDGEGGIIEGVCRTARGVQGLGCYCFINGTLTVQLCAPYGDA